MPFLFFALFVQLCLPSTAFGQPADWRTLLRDSTSSDEATKEAAQKEVRARREELIKAEPELVQDDIALLLEATENGEEVRFQATVMLVVVSFLRQRDSEVVFSKAVPRLLALFYDDNPKVRENVIRIIATLKPQIPNDALPYFLKAVRREKQEDNRPAVELAIGGLGRLAKENSSVVALDEMVRLSLPDQPDYVRSDVAHAISRVGLRDPRFVGNLREMLRDENNELVLRALQAVSRMGRIAVSLQKELRRIVEETADSRLLETAIEALSSVRQTQ